MIKIFGQDFNYLNVRHLPPQAKAYRVYDGRGGGLFLEVLPSGLRKWRLRCRYGGRTKVITLGAYPKLSPAAARQAADRIRAQYVPQDQLPAVPAEGCRSFEDLLDFWQTLDRSGLPARAGLDGTLLEEKYLRPALGSLPLYSLKPEVLEERLFQPIISQGLPDIARRVRTLFRQIFRFAETMGLVRTRSGKPDPADLLTPRGYRWPVNIDPDVRADHFADFVSHYNGFKLVHFAPGSPDLK